MLQLLGISLTKFEKASKYQAQAIQLVKQKSDRLDLKSTHAKAWLANYIKDKCDNTSTCSHLPEFFTWDDLHKIYETETKGKEGESFGNCAGTDLFQKVRREHGHHLHKPKPGNFSRCLVCAKFKKVKITARSPAELAANLVASKNHVKIEKAQRVAAESLSQTAKFHPDRLLMVWVDQSGPISFPHNQPNVMCAHRLKCGRGGTKSDSSGSGEFRAEVEADEGEEEDEECEEKQEMYEDDEEEKYISVQ